MLVFGVLLSRKDKPLSLIIIFSFLLSCFFIFIHALLLGAETINTSFATLLRVAYLLGIYVFYQYMDKEKTVKFVVNIVVIILFCNTVSFFLVLVLDMQPLYELTLHNGHIARLYFLSFSVVDMNFGSFRFLRGGGIFDEPGALGFVSFLALLINGVYKGSPQKSIVIVVLGLFSFSMAFIILSFLYCLINLKISRKILLYAATVIIVGGLLLKMLPPEKLEIIYGYTVGRVVNLNSVSGSQPQSSNTRSHINNVSMKLIVESPIFGVGEKFALEYSKYFGTASIFSYFAIYGILGYLFYALPLIVIIFKNCSVALMKLKKLYILLLFSLLFYQRPYWDLPLNFILILMLFEGMGAKKVNMVGKSE